MKIGYQLVGQPEDFRYIDSSLWHTLGDTPINEIVIQGMHEGGDILAVKHIDADTAEVHTVQNDPNDYHEDDRIAHVSIFRTIQPDANLGGAYNTAITRYTYAGSNLRDTWVNSETILRPYGDYVLPDSNLIRFGQWMDDEVYAAHRAALSNPGWREWTERLTSDEIVLGKVRQQRRVGRYVIPDGTRTYYARSTNLANGIHTASHENEFATTTGSLTEEIVSIAKVTDVLAFTAVTPAGEPDSAAWPTGDYRYQIDVTTGTTDINCGLLTIGGSAGHFARTNAAITSDLETKTQAAAKYNTTGLHLAATGSVSWSSGTDTDRFEALVAGENTHTHSSRDLGITFDESDDFADGPWAAAAAPTGDPLYYSQAL